MAWSEQASRAQRQPKYEVRQQRHDEQHRRTDYEMLDENARLPSELAEVYFKAREQEQSDDAERGEQAHGGVGREEPEPHAGRSAQRHGSHGGRHAVAQQHAGHDEQRKQQRDVIELAR